jgi:hypothetical protein
MLNSKSKTKNLVSDLQFRAKSLFDVSNFGIRICQCALLALKLHHHTAQLIDLFVVLEV